MNPHKFKQEQEVMVLQFMINSQRRDISATIQKYVYNRTTKDWNVEVLLNGVFIVLTEDRMVDSVQYWKEQNI